jgi:GNAT superfamily N-acetyltransferase
VIAFTPFADHKPGTVASLLSQSYTAYLAFDPQAAEVWPVDWASYDRDVYQHPDTVGACGFVTCAIGLASWDPRAHPAYGMIGHNCILPAYQGQGYGRAQIRRVLDILRARGFQAARVTTGDHPFFRPAQRVYEVCGFREVGCSASDSHSSFGTIDYGLLLKTPGSDRGPRTDDRRP